MTAVAIQLVLLSALVPASIPPAAIGMSSPLSWSTDSQWLSYTVVSDLETQGLSATWLFDTSGQPPAGGLSGTIDRKALRSQLYRIWATAPGDGISVLIEESRWPLTAPSWSPRGKSIAYGRFVARTSDPHRSGQRGRLEVVIQTALEVKKVVWSSPEFELDQAAWDLVPHLSCSWSADQAYVAVPLPTPEPQVVLVNTNTKKRVHVIDNAVLPVWAPDGSKCAYIRREGGTDSVEFVERRGSGFSEPRSLVVSGVPRAAPFWGPDGRSIILVVEKPDTKLLDIELARYSLDNRDVTRLLSLVPEARQRKSRLKSVTIDFDRDSDRCFFALDLEGHEFDLVSCTPQEHEIQQRFHPLDVTQRIAVLAVSPDSKSVAMRFGSAADLSPPAVFDAESERTVLLVPDDTCRKEWLKQLITVATRLLSGGLPPASFDGQAASRPSLLPLPGELAALGMTIPRLDRIAKYGSPLCPARSQRTEFDEQPSLVASDLQARLFFNVLQGQFRDAASDLDALERHVELPENRLAVLSLRAQILWSQGERDRARSIIEYLLASEGTSTERVEETPLGLVATKEVSPAQAWARYLSAQAAAEPMGLAHPSHERSTKDLDVMPKDPFGMPELPSLEPGRMLVPLIPEEPRR